MPLIVPESDPQHHLEIVGRSDQARVVLHPVMDRLERKTVQPVDERYDRQVERAVHDRGGWQIDAPIDRTEHDLTDWELLMDAIAGTLGNRGVMNVDEFRRAIESMEPEAYEQSSYYERWLFAAETILLEKGVLAPGELDARVAR